MLSKPTVAQLRSAVHLVGQPAWKDVESMIDNEISAILALMLDSRETVVLHQMQGRGRALRDLKRVMAECREMLEKVERPSSGARGF